MKNKTILLVEDNPDEELLTLRALKESKCVKKIEVARDGEEAVNCLLGRKKAYPHLIILDLNLPKMNGIEVLKKIKTSSDSLLKTIPVIVLSSSRESQDVIESYRSGASSFIQKPTDYLKFYEIIQKIEQYWFELNELGQSRVK